MFDGTDETIWNKYIGGKVPVTSHFTLQSTIDKDPPKMQAFVTAIWRATQWIKTHSPDEIYEAIEPYVGSTSRGANILEITALQKVADYDATIDAAGFARGEKVWFREMTGIKPLTIAEVVSPTFIEAARKAYPLERTDAIADASCPDSGAERIAVRRPQQIVPARGHGHRGGARCFLQRPARRIRCLAGTVGLRQEHDPQHDRDAGKAEQRSDPDRRHAGRCRQGDA